MTIKTRLLVFAFNWFPAFRRTGGRIVWMANDQKEIRLRLALNWRTKNYVGSLFGGSMYAFVDPIYMVMFIRLLGPAYVVWDKSASIRYRRPGRSALHATCIVADEELIAIRTELEAAASIERVYSIKLLDGNGLLCAEVEKRLYFSKRKREKPG